MHCRAKYLQVWLYDASAAAATANATTNAWLPRSHADAAATSDASDATASDASDAAVYA